MDKPWSELSARERDALVEVVVFRRHVEWLVGRERYREGVPPEGKHHIGEPYRWDGTRVPYYTYLHDAAIQVEDEMNRQGLGDAYTDVLDESVGYLSHVRASPDQRCEAAVRVLKEQANAKESTRTDAGAAKDL